MGGDVSSACKDCWSDATTLARFDGNKQGISVKGSGGKDPIRTRLTYISQLPMGTPKNNLVVCCVNTPIKPVIQGSRVSVGRGTPVRTWAPFCELVAKDTVNTVCGLNLWRLSDKSAGVFLQLSLYAAPGIQPNFSMPTAVYGLHLDSENYNVSTETSPNALSPPYLIWAKKENAKNQINNELDDDNDDDYDSKTNLIEKNHTKTRNSSFISLTKKNSIKGGFNQLEIQLRNIKLFKFSGLVALKSGKPELLNVDLEQKVKLNGTINHTLAPEENEWDGMDIYDTWQDFEAICSSPNARDDRGGIAFKLEV